MERSRLDVALRSRTRWRIATFALLALSALLLRAIPTTNEMALVVTWRDAIRACAADSGVLVSFSIWFDLEAGWQATMICAPEPGEERDT